MDLISVDVLISPLRAELGILSIGTESIAKFTVSMQIAEIMIFLVAAFFTVPYALQPSLPLEERTIDDCLDAIHSKYEACNAAVLAIGVAFGLYLSAWFVASNQRNIVTTVLAGIVSVVVVPLAVLFRRSLHECVEV